MLKKAFFLLVPVAGFLFAGCDRGTVPFTEDQVETISHAEMRSIVLVEKDMGVWKTMFAKWEEERNDTPTDSPDHETGEEPNSDFQPTEVDIAFVNGVYQLDKKFFNQIQTVDGVDTIQNPENILVLANKSFSLPSTYKPKDLVQPNVPFVFQNVEQNYLRKEAAHALEKMFAAAKEEGVNLIARSGFRSYQTQAYLFDREVETVGYDKAVLAVAKPGTSEHQTGLTMDITANSVNQQLVESFGETKEGKWLEHNAHRFGFILRYPKGKESITKYQYEPWHFRYVGVEAATVIYENGWTLEEFFNTVKEI